MTKPKEYILRVTCPDRFGVVAKVSTCLNESELFILGKFNVSIFVFVLLSFIIKEAWMPKFYTIMKSIAYVRYLILYIVLRFLVSKNILNFKFFFIPEYIWKIL